MPVFPIGDSPVHVGNTYSKPYVISNDGPRTVYLGPDSSVSPTNYGQLLQANGGSVTRDGGQPTWAVCGNGDSSTVSVLYDATSAGAPAPTSVGLLSNAELIQNWSGTSTALSGGAGTVSLINLLLDSNVLDIRDYSTIRFVISARGTATPDPTKYISSLFSTRDEGNDITISFYEPQWLLQVNPPSGNWASIDFPVDGEKLQATVRVTSAAAIPSIDWNISAWGYTLPINAPKYESTGNGYVGSASRGGFASVSQAVIGTTTSYIDSKAGLASLMLNRLLNTALVTATLEALEDGVATQIAQLSIPAGATLPNAVMAQLALPMRPLRLTTTVATAATTARATLTPIP